MGVSPHRTDAYDVIVIGTGQGGSPLAESLAASGRRAALIERGPVGGTCINVGCTPTKTMVASAKVAWLARRGAEYGVHAGSPSVDVKEVRRRKQGVVDSFRNGKQQRLERTVGLDLVRGEGSFEDARTVIVKGSDGSVRRLTSGTIVINTGCRPARPAIEGIESIAPLDSSSIMELDETPSHLIVIGGGYIGLEFGQMFRRFGSEVTIVQRGKALLGREDPDIAREVATILTAEGIRVMLETSPAKVRSRGEEARGEAGGRSSRASGPGAPPGGGIGRLALTVRTPRGEEVLRGSHLLFAAGRTPNTEGLGLDRAGIRTDEKGFIQVSERLETTAPGVYAIGDVKGGPAFTHISYDDYRILRTNMLEGGSATTRHRFVPYTVFIDPQLGRVGMSEEEARAAGGPVKIYRMPMTSVARAIELGETRGFLKAIVDAETDRILGFAALGIDGGELMSAVEIAMMGGVGAAALREATFAHPVLAESLNTLFASTASLL